MIDKLLTFLKKDNIKDLYKKVETDLEILDNINYIYTKKLEDIKKHILKNDTYLKKDYTIRKNEADITNYNKLLFNEIKLSTNKQKGDIRPDTDINSIIRDKTNEIKQRLESIEQNNYKSTSINHNLKNLPDYSKTILKKIETKTQDLTDIETPIRNIDTNIINYMKGFRRYIESPQFQKIYKEYREDIEELYNQTYTEHSIANTIFSKKKLSIELIRRINTNLLKTNSSEFCLEAAIESINTPDMYDSFKNILGYTKNDKSFHFHNSVSNILKEIEKENLIEPEELQDIKDMVDQTSNI